MRLFVGVRLSDEIQYNVAKLQTQLKRCASGLKFIPVDNMHLTMKFLGEVREESVEEVKDAFGRVAMKMKPFRISFKSVGVFPHEQQISVIWVGLDEGKDQCIELMNITEKELSFVRKETKSTHPHLTIARVASAQWREAIVKFVHAHQQEEFGSCMIDSLVLFESVMTKEGVKYNEVYTLPLE